MERKEEFPDMIEESHGDLTLLRFDWLSDEPGLVHAVTTRPANYAPHRGRGRAEAVAWRQRVCDALNVPFENLTSPEQVMGGEVLPIGDGDVGCGRDGRDSAVRFVDGLVLDRPGVPMILLSADCPLVCVYDPDLIVVGAVHTSWQGTMAGAAENLVTQMVRTFGCDTSRLRAAISPSAGPCCYEVGEEVRRIARTKLKDADVDVADRNGRLVLDLWSANRRQLLGTGIPPDRIEVAGLCSICDERFWSHRRDGSDAGRFALFVALRA